MLHRWQQLSSRMASSTVKRMLALGDEDCIEPDRTHQWITRVVSIGLRNQNNRCPFLTLYMGVIYVQSLSESFVSLKDAMGNVPERNCRVPWVCSTSFSEKTFIVTVLSSG
jgi:hypothetical protein